MKQMKFLVLGLMLLALNPAFSQSKRVLVISGGGSLGAWGGGVAESLVNEHNNHYDVVVGASTGSLLAPLVAAEDFTTLKNGYTTITDRDVFSVKPFHTSGAKKGQIKKFQAFIRLILPGAKSLGESKNLKKTIRRFYTEEHYEGLKRSGKTHIATVVNITKDSTEYKSSKDHSYEEIVEWMWASANAPLFMSLHKVKEYGEKTYYTDGGVKEGLPLNYGIRAALETGADYVDVIIHSTPNSHHKDMEKSDVIGLLGRTIEVFLSENRQNDLSAANGIISAMAEDCDENRADMITVTYYFMPEDHYNTIPYEFIFDKDEMSSMWEKGASIGKMKPQQSKYIIQVKVPKDQVETLVVTR